MLAKAKRELPDAEVVILTGHSTVKTAVTAMQAGQTLAVPDADPSTLKRPETAAAEIIASISAVLPAYSGNSELLVKPYAEFGAPEKLDVVIFRENTEDVYAGIEFREGTPEVKKLISLSKTTAT